MRGVTIRSVLRDAAAIALFAAVFATIFNGVRKEGIDWIRTEPYAILVPCPETEGDADRLAPTHELLSDPQILLVDARSEADALKDPVPGAMNIPYDYLTEIPADALERIATSGAAQVAVFGDGGVPDSGEQLAREISGRGIRNVGFVTGGAPALNAARKTTAGGKK